MLNVFTQSLRQELPMKKTLIFNFCISSLCLIICVYPNSIEKNGIERSIKKPVNYNNFSDNCNIVTFLPVEIWQQILEYLPGNDYALHYFLYLKCIQTVPQTEEIIKKPQIPLTKAIAKNIIRALNNYYQTQLHKYEEMPDVPLALPNLYDFKPLKMLKIKPSTLRTVARYVYQSAPDENKNILKQKLIQYIEQQHEPDTMILKHLKSDRLSAVSIALFESNLLTVQKKYSIINE